MVNTETISTNWNKSNEEAYEGLIVSLEANRDILNLLICVCDSSQFREEVIERYCKELEPDIPCYRITLNQKEPSLRAAIAELVNQSAELQQKTRAVITATGIERLHSMQWNEEKSELDKFFGYLQWTREGLREFPYSIVLWVTSTVEVNLRKKAPDFWSWRKGVFRFVSSQSNFVSCGDFLPILQSFEEIYTDNEVPLISLEDLLELIQQIETTKGKKEPRLASLYSSLAKIYQNRLNQGQTEDYGKEQDLAIEYYQKAIYLQKTLNLELALADSFNRLAGFYYSRGQYEQALNYYQQSLAIFRQIEDIWGEGICYNSLGNVYNFLGRYEEAINDYQQSLAIFQQIKNTAREGISHYNLGVTFTKLNRKIEAKEAFQKARDLYQRMGLEKYIQYCDDRLESLEENNFV